jgi:peptide/nickel transport system permease protein
MATASKTQVGSLEPKNRYENRTMRRMIWQRFTQHKLALASLIILIVLVLASFGAPLIRPDRSAEIGFRERSALRDLPPSLEHPMGTDSLGRDMLSRILYGGRISLSVGFLAISLAIVIGTTIGGLAGFYGGTLDNVLMRLVDMMLSLPRLFMLILMTILLRSLNSPALQFLGGVPVIVLVIGILAWMGTARIVRATFLSLKEKEFVEAARAAGASNLRIMLRHLLPNAMSPIIVAATLGLANAIIAESGLSFLGLGVQPPTPTWGNMLNTAQSEMLKGHTWMAVFPGLMIFITVICMNYIGDGLRDALDPHKNS